MALIMVHSIYVGQVLRDYTVPLTGVHAQASRAELLYGNVHTLQYWHRNVDVIPSQ